MPILPGIGWVPVSGRLSVIWLERKVTMNTTERDVRIVAGVSVLRGLRASPTLRRLLNRMGDVIMRAVLKDRLDVVAKARTALRNLRTGLLEEGGADDAILANALDGVLELITPVNTGWKGFSNEN